MNIKFSRNGRPLIGLCAIGDVGSRRRKDDRDEASRYSPPWKSMSNPRGAAARGLPGPCSHAQCAAAAIGASAAPMRALCSA